MSFTATDPAAVPAIGPQSAVARIAELQQLISQARCGGAASNGGASFADALAGAGAGPSAAAAATGFPGTAGAYGTTAAHGTSGAPGTPGAGTNVTAADTAGTTPYDGLVTASAQRYGVDPALLHGLIQQESGFDPSSTSGAGAVGLCQLMPGTAASLGVSNPLDPAQSIDGGARYLRQQLDAFGGDPSLALAAYNAGSGAVRRYGGVPPYAETQAYVQKVLGYANAYRSSHPAMGATAAALSTSTPSFS
ncbi:MAG TPA: lytic transglycosylase domain-containing protein [Conexibacter sp.]|nr:lytic transglycosylase domain-containing protein [Conexibacter sp.]